VEKVEKIDNVSGIWIRQLRRSKLARSQSGQTNATATAITISVVQGTFKKYPEDKRHKIVSSRFFWRYFLEDVLHKLPPNLRVCIF